MEDFEQEKEKKNYGSFILYLIWGALIVIIIMLFSIHDTLKEIYRDTHYSTASTDYLYDIKNAVEK